VSERLRDVRGRDAAESIALVPVGATDAPIIVPKSSVHMEPPQR
jgi:hypothetical protein